jgi:hypothetical protein
LPQSWRAPAFFSFFKVELASDLQINFDGGSAPDIDLSHRQNRDVLRIRLQCADTYIEALTLLAFLVQKYKY